MYNTVKAKNENLKMTATKGKRNIAALQNGITEEQRYAAMRPF